MNVMLWLAKKKKKIVPLQYFSTMCLSKSGPKSTITPPGDPRGRFSEASRLDSFYMNL